MNMNNILAIIAVVVLLSIAAVARGEEPNKQTQPVTMVVQLDMDICDQNKKLMDMNDLFGQGNVMFYVEEYGYIVVPPNWQIVMELKKLEICKEITDEFVDI